MLLLHFLAGDVSSKVIIMLLSYVLLFVFVMVITIKKPKSQVTGLGRGRNLVCISCMWIKPSWSFTSNNLIVWYNLQVVASIYCSGQIKGHMTIITKLQPKLLCRAIQTGVSQQLLWNSSNYVYAHCMHGSHLFRGLYLECLAQKHFSGKKMLITRHCKYNLLGLQDVDGKKSKSTTP